jgi:hypothetical protein
MGAMVEIVAVTPADNGCSELHGGFLDAPRAGALVDAEAVDVIGWALGAGRRALAAELAIDGSPLGRAPLNAPRPDLSAAFPEREEAGRAGFRTTLNLTGTAPEFELQVSVVLEGRRRAALGSVRGRRRWRREHSPVFARLVSVVIPCHAGAGGIDEAIESALAQTYAHVEVVVIDGDRSGGVAAIASRYPGVRCIGEPECGPAEARNAGIRASNGDFLMFLDPHDTLCAEAARAGLDALDERPECAAALATGERAGYERDGPRAAGGSAGVEGYARLLREGWARSAEPRLYRRSLLEHVRAFDPAAGAAAALAFDLRVAREFAVCVLPEQAGAPRADSPRERIDPTETLGAALRALRRERRHVRGTPALRHALREGTRRCRRTWGELLIDQTRASLRDRRYAEAVRQAAALARRRPVALAGMLRAGPRSSEGSQWR